MSRTICIANQKDGVDKTTTAINLAASLTAAKKRTLLMDMDPQKNANNGVGIDKGALEESIYNALINSAEAERLMIPTELPFLSILPTTADLTSTELELATIPEREYALKKALTPLTDHYDFILINCPPSLGLLTINALVAARSVLVPLQYEFYTMEGLSQILRTINLVQKGLNPGLNIEGILLTMFDGRNNLARQVTEEIRNHFKEQAFQTVVPRNVRLSEAPNHSKPIILYNITSRGAVSYLKLARELIERSTND